MGRDRRHWHDTVSRVKCRLFIYYPLSDRVASITLSWNVLHHLKSWDWQLCLSRRLMALRLMDALCWAESLPQKRWRLKMRNWLVYSVKVGPLGLFWSSRCSTSVSFPSHNLKRDIVSSAWHPKLSQRWFWNILYGNIAFCTLLLCSHYPIYPSLSNPGHVDYLAFDKSIEDPVAVICRDECWALPRLGNFSWFPWNTWMSARWWSL